MENVGGRIAGESRACRGIRLRPGKRRKQNCERHGCLPTQLDHHPAAAETLCARAVTEHSGLLSVRDVNWVSQGELEQLVGHELDDSGELDVLRHRRQGRARHDFEYQGNRPRDRIIQQRSQERRVGLGGSLLHSKQTSAALTGDVASAFESAGQALVEMVNNNIDSTDDAVQKYTQGDQLMCTAANAGNQQAHVSDMPGMQ